LGFKGLPKYKVDRTQAEVKGIPTLDEWEPEPKGNFKVKAVSVPLPALEDPRITRLKLLAKEKKLEKQKKAKEAKA